jgi:hypothetical protein
LRDDIRHIALHPDCIGRSYQIGVVILALPIEDPKVV